MRNKHLLTCHGGVVVFMGDLYVSQHEREIVSNRLIMIAGNVDDLGALATLAEDLLDHLIVGLGPIPTLAELPHINDVAN